MCGMQNIELLSTKGNWLACEPVEIFNFVVMLEEYFTNGCCFIDFIPS